MHPSNKKKLLIHTHREKRENWLRFHCTQRVLSLSDPAAFPNPARRPSCQPVPASVSVSLPQLLLDLSSLLQLPCPSLLAGDGLGLATAGFSKGLLSARAHIYRTASSQACPCPPLSPDRLSREQLSHVDGWPRAAFEDLYYKRCRLPSLHCDLSV